MPVISIETKGLKEHLHHHGILQVLANYWRNCYFYEKYLKECLITSSILHKGSLIKQLFSDMFPRYERKVTQC